MDSGVLAPNCFLWAVASPKASSTRQLSEVSPVEWTTIFLLAHAHRMDAGHWMP